jgi:hydroxyacylglutathione hydrolase
MAPKPERVAEGVWRIAGDLRSAMNVYLIEDGDGVTQFDAGTKAMRRHTERIAAEMGGLKRIVLGHSHADHRGTAADTKAPVYCHTEELDDALGDGGRHYMDLQDIPWWFTRYLYPPLLKRWDGGPVKIAETISEGDEVAGFKVVHLPGHAPGLIGLFRESDGVALVSDVVYQVDSIKLKPLPEEDAPMVPHPVWAHDYQASIESVRKLAGLGARCVLPGHEGALEGTPEHVANALNRAADRAAATPDT